MVFFPAEGRDALPRGLVCVRATSEIELRIVADALCDPPGRRRRWAKRVHLSAGFGVVVDLLRWLAEAELDHDFSDCRRLRGGAGRTRTNHQSVMECGGVRPAHLVGHQALELEEGRY